jgi:hypothetical protein
MSSHGKEMQIFRTKISNIWGKCPQLRMKVSGSREICEQLEQKCK